MKKITKNFAKKKRCQCILKNGIDRCSQPASKAGVNPKTKKPYDTRFCKRFHQLCDNKFFGGKDTKKIINFREKKTNKYFG